MTGLAVGGYFYNGLQRWDLGLDSPNKAAAILALALIPLLAAILRTRRTWLAWCCAAASSVIGGVLAHTFSRGGLAALLVGGATLLAGESKRLRAGRKWLPILAVAAAITAATFCLGFSRRIASSAPGADGSVGNRLALWRAVPCMMADAPGGWGHGSSGDAFMCWYQPLSRHERYRTLVNSHFTWLAEFGWPGRFALICGWMLVLGLCATRLKERGDALPLSVWLAFGTAAFFSSVAEDPFVWAIPATSLLLCRTVRLRICGIAVAAGALLTATFALCGHLLPMDGPPVRRTFDGSRVILGSGEPTDWIVFDGKTMGGNTYGRALRAFAMSPEGSGRCFCVAADLSCVPRTVRRLALCGRSADGGPAILDQFRELDEVRVLSPSRPTAWLGSGDGRRRPAMRIICGDLSPHCPADDVQGLTAVPGAGEYLPGWPELAFR